MSTVPSFGFMRAHWSRWLALGFGSGLAPVAPGTAGTSFGWLAYGLMSQVMHDTALLVLIVWSLLLGVWICEQTVRALGVHDHPAIVWDEIAAFWAVLLIVGGSFLTQLVVFALFRFFDAVKPWPISWLDKNVKGGLGVMVDDLAAAIATIVVLWVLRSYLPI